MNEMEKLTEVVAADLIMVSIDDLPGLAKLHDGFLQIAKLCRNDLEIAAQAAGSCAQLVEKIILNEVSDKDRSLSVLNEAMVALQSLLRDHREPSEVHFPSELGLPATSARKIESLTANSPKNEKDNVKESQPKALGQNKEQPKSTPETQSPPLPPAKMESFMIDLAGSDTSLLGDFITEAREHCATAEQMLMDLETGSDNQAAINAIFRSFHTIKGAAGFLELKPISVLAHESETLLDLGRKGTITIAGHIADTIFDAIDIMRKLLDNLEEIIKSEGSFDGAPYISSVIERLQQIIENPELSSMEEPPHRVGDILIEMGAVSQDKIDEALTRRERPDEKLGETLVKQGLVPAKVVAHALRDQQSVKREKPGGGAVKEMVKIDTERLDRLVDTIGELVIAESMVGQDEEILAIVSPKIARNISHLNKITRELQEMGMAMRLVPVRPTFQKLARAIRDLSRKSGKEVELVMSGEETEVDRSIVENIGDPLMHMVRNAVDHGLESPEERERVGKSKICTVTIRAYHKGGNIYFDVEDDGKGLDKDRILVKARERGLIPPDKELTEKEVYNLILLPGFSTAQKITDISGRGVGMDVVRKNVELMRGHLEISSTPGKGTIFSIKLPLTLAIIDGMLVSVEDEKFIIPTLSIVESLSLASDMIFTVSGKAEMINLRGELLPLLRISELFHMKTSGTGARDKTVVVVEDGLKRVGLVIDKLLGQRQTVIKSLGPVFNNQKWIAGGAILSDGNVGLIIDVGGVAALAAARQEKAAREHTKLQAKHSQAPSTYSQSQGVETDEKAKLELETIT